MQNFKTQHRVTFVQRELTTQAIHMPLFLARHGERLDYDQLKKGVVWANDAARPWDPPLTPAGEEQGALLGSGAAVHASRLGLPPITRVISSPLLRCMQTAAAAAEKLGLPVSVEPGLAEGVGEDWYRSWAVEGANGSWGANSAPVSAQTATEPSAARRAEATQPAGTLLLDGKEYLGPRRDASYVPVWPAEQHTSCWDRFETEEDLANRLTAVLLALHERYPTESILALSHGGPCAHGFRGVTGLESPVTGYTALYVMVRDDDAGKWTAPLVADTSHLTAQGLSSMD